MKATIDELWDTGREIISFDGDEFERPQRFTDLKACENVLLGDKIPGTKMREVFIDDTVVLVGPTKVRHPVGGTMYILEVLLEVCKETTNNKNIDLTCTVQLINPATNKAIKTLL